MADHPTPALILVIGAPGAGAAALVDALAEALARRVDGQRVSVQSSTALLEALTATDRGDAADTAAAAATPTPRPVQPSAEPGLKTLEALQRHRQAHLTLLMGLDQPPPLVPTLPARADALPREACDALLRAALDSAGVPYRVVYGQGPQRVEHALKAINLIAENPYPSSANGNFGSDFERERPARLRAWNCEKCSDPECEHRLFTALTGQGVNGR
ncbi:hypothetical protein [Paracidovorax sp. MALMAid1276]|uniref:hypothetical protein n=1 Tax=Paracidovorax sp. MALMAid1276 TaxID=3411631 RepID=UPI003B9C72F0